MKWTKWSFPNPPQKQGQNGVCLAAVEGRFPSEWVILKNIHILGPLGTTISSLSEVYRNVAPVIHKRLFWKRNLASSIPRQLKGRPTWGGREEGRFCPKLSSGRLLWWFWVAAGGWGERDNLWNSQKIDKYLENTQGYKTAKQKKKPKPVASADHWEGYF